MGALKLDWLGRWRNRRGQRGRPARPMLIASRDLPPLEGLGRTTLPRSPEPFSDSEMQFASRAAGRAAEERDMAPADIGVGPRVMRGADLRALLERFERDCMRHDAQIGRVMPGRPALRLVTAGMPVRQPAGGSTGDLLSPESDAALAAALDTLRKLSSLARR